MNQKISKKISLYKTAKGFAILYLIASILIGLMLIIMLITATIYSGAITTTNDASQGTGQVSADAALAAFVSMFSVIAVTLPLLLIIFILSIIIIVKSGRMINSLGSANPYNTQETLTLPVICLFLGLMLPGIFMLVAQSIVLERPRVVVDQQNAIRPNPTPQTNMSNQPSTQTPKVTSSVPEVQQATVKTSTSSASRISKQPVEKQKPAATKSEHKVNPKQVAKPAKTSSAASGAKPKTPANKAK